MQSPNTTRSRKHKKEEIQMKKTILVLLTIVAIAAFGTACKNEATSTTDPAVTTDTGTTMATDTAMTGTTSTMSTDTMSTSTSGTTMTDTSATTMTTAT